MSTDLGTLRKIEDPLRTLALDAIMAPDTYAVQVECSLFTSYGENDNVVIVIVHAFAMLRILPPAP